MSLYTMFHDLHQIILSLTTKEVNRIKHFLAHSDTGDAHQYELLFTCLYDMGEDYEEALVRDFCEEHGFAFESVRSNSYNLYEHVMFYLRDPRIRPDPVWKIECLLKDVGILETKNLFDLCFKKLEDAIKMAKDHHLPDLEYKAHLAYSSLLLKQPDAKVIKQVIEEYELAKQAWTNYLRSEETIQANHHAFQLLLAQTSDLSELRESLNPDIDAIPSGLSFFAQLRYAQTRSIFFRQTANYPAHLQWQKEALRIFTDTPAFQKSFPFEYLATLGNYTNAAFINGEWSLFKNGVEKLKEFQTEDPHLKCLRDSIVALEQLNYWLNHPAEMAKVTDEDLEEIKETIEECQPYISTSKYTAITVGLALNYFFRNNYDFARHWWQQVSVGYANDIQPKTQRMALLIGLLNDYADPTYRINGLVTRVETVQKKLRKIDPDEPQLYFHEKTAVFYLRKLSKLPERAPKARKELLEKFHKKLKDHRKTTPHEGGMTCSVLLRWLQEELNIPDDDLE